MKTLIAAAAILGFSAVAASAECSNKHSAQLKTDNMTTASVATDEVKMSTVDKTVEEKALQEQKD